MFRTWCSQRPKRVYDSQFSDDLRAYSLGSVGPVAVSAGRRYRLALPVGDHNLTTLEVDLPQQNEDAYATT
jgi:hypothetical protein